MPLMIGRMGCQAGHRYHGNASYLASNFFLVSVTVGQTAIPEPLETSPEGPQIHSLLISNLHKLAGYFAPDLGIVSDAESAC